MTSRSTRKREWKVILGWMLSLQMAFSPSLAWSQSRPTQDSPRASQEITPWARFIDQANQLVRATHYQGAAGNQYLSAQDPSEFLEEVATARNLLEQDLSNPSSIRFIDYQQEDQEKISLKILNFYNVAIQVLKSAAAQSLSPQDLKSFFSSKEFQEAFRLRVPLYALANGPLLTTLAQAPYLIESPSFPFQARMYAYGENKENYAVLLEPKAITMTLAYPSRFQLLEEREAILETIRYTSAAYYLESYFRLQMSQGVRPYRYEPPVDGFEKIYPFFEEMKAAHIKGYEAKSNFNTLEPIMGYKADVAAEEELIGLPRLLAEASMIQNFASPDLIRKVLSCRLSLTNTQAVLNGFVHQLPCDLQSEIEILDEAEVNQLHQDLKDNLIPPSTEETEEEAVIAASEDIGSHIEAARSEDYLESLILLWGLDKDLGPPDTVLKRLITEAKALAVLDGTAGSSIAQSEVLAQGGIAKNLNFYTSESKEAFLRKKIYHHVVQKHRTSYNEALTALDLTGLEQKIHEARDPQFPIQIYQRTLNRVLRQSSLEIKEALDNDEGLEPVAWAAVNQEWWNNELAPSPNVRSQLTEWLESANAGDSIPARFISATSSYHMTLASYIQQWKKLAQLDVLQKPKYQSLIEETLAEIDRDQEYAVSGNYFSNAQFQIEQIWDQTSQDLAPDFEFQLARHPSLLTALIESVPLDPSLSPDQRYNEDLAQLALNHPERFKDDFLDVITMGRQMGFFRALSPVEGDSVDVLTVNSLTSDSELIEDYNNELLKMQSAQFPILYMPADCKNFLGLSRPILGFGKNCPRLFELIANVSPEAREEIQKAIQVISSNIQTDLKQLVESENIEDVAERAITSKKLYTLVMATPGLVDDYLTWAGQHNLISMPRMMFEKAFNYASIGVLPVMGYYVFALLTRFTPLGRVGSIRDWVAKIGARYGKLFQTYFLVWFGGLITSESLHMWADTYQHRNNVQRGFFSQIGGTGDGFYTWSQAHESDENYKEQLREYVAWRTFDVAIIGLMFFRPISRFIRAHSSKSLHRKHYESVQAMDRSLHELGIDDPKKYLEVLKGRVNPRSNELLSQFRQTIEALILENQQLSLAKRWHLARGLIALENQTSRLMKLARKRHLTIAKQIKKESRYFELNLKPGDTPTQSMIQGKLEEFAIHAAEKLNEVKRLQKVGAKGARLNIAKAEYKLAEYRYYSGLKRARRLHDALAVENTLIQNFPYYESLIHKMLQSQPPGMRGFIKDLLARMRLTRAQAEKVANEAHLNLGYEAFIQHTARGPKVIYKRTAPYRLSQRMQQLVGDGPLSGKIYPKLQGWVNQ